MVIGYMPADESSYGTRLVNNLRVLSTTNSTSSTTGAIVCDGGLGIAGDLTVAGTITGGSIVYATTITGTLDVSDPSGTTLLCESNQQCTGAGTGSAIFDGGVYIAKNLYVDGTLVAGAITYASTSTGTLTITDSPGTTLQCDSIEESTTKTNGSATFAGGIGVDKKINANNLELYGGTQSTSSTTGVLIAAGGIGATGNIYAGGGLYGGSVTSSGSIVNGGFDLILGNSDQVSRGDSGASRAIVKIAGNILNLNYANDFTGGVLVDSNFKVVGNTEAGGFDIILGTSDQVSRGNSGNSRALVKDDGNILTINFNEDFTGGTKIDSALQVTGTASFGVATINGLTVFGDAEFSGLTVSGTSVFNAITASGNSVFSAVTLNAGLVANSGVTLNAGMVSNSAVTIAGAVGTSALTIAGAVGFSAMTIQFGGTNVYDVAESGTTVNNVNITNILDVTNEVKVNNTTVIVNDGGSLNLAVNNANVSGTSTAANVNATSAIQVNGDPVITSDGGITSISVDNVNISTGVQELDSFNALVDFKLNSTPVIINDGGSLNIAVNNASISGTTTSATLNASNQVTVNDVSMATESGGVVTVTADIDADIVNTDYIYGNVGIFSGPVTADNFGTTTYPVSVRNYIGSGDPINVTATCKVHAIRDSYKVLIKASYRNNVNPTQLYFRVDMEASLLGGDTYQGLGIFGVQEASRMYLGKGFLRVTSEVIFDPTPRTVYHHDFFILRHDYDDAMLNNLDNFIYQTGFNTGQSTAWLSYDIY